MLWFDWMTLGIILAVAVLQAVGAAKVDGFSLALFQALFVSLAAVAAVALYRPLALALNLERWVALAGLFIVLGIAALLLGRLAYSFTGWSFGTFDAPLGFIFGLVTGWAVAHVVLRVIVEKQGYSGPVAQNLARAPVAAEVYWFRTWNKLASVLFKARFGGREMWDVDKHGIE
ncbi:MAG: hypothetical protein R6X12_08210 [bacterium]